MHKCILRVTLTSTQAFIKTTKEGGVGGQEEGEEVPTRGDQNLVGITVSSLHSHQLISNSDAG